MSTAVTANRVPRRRTVAEASRLAAAESILEAEAGRQDDARRLTFARGVCTDIARRQWKAIRAELDFSLPIRRPVAPAVSSAGAEAAADALRCLPPAAAGYRIGNLYTRLLPPSTRKQLGAYYTPPHVVARLLRLAEEAGVDWASDRILDPACGGSAFLAPIVERLVASTPWSSADRVLDDIEARIRGIEIDPFAAWLSGVVIDMVSAKLISETGRRPRPRIETRDSLSPPLDACADSDLVIGNPPYGRVTLPASVRQAYAESVFGHANLYALFTHLAVRLVRRGGVVALVTPTSFLSGEYFKRLRDYLVRHAPPIAAEFVEEREGVFDGVLQETMLALFRKEDNAGPAQVRVSRLRTNRAPDTVDAVSLGQITLPTKGGQPWMFPRKASQRELLSRAVSMKCRLRDLGYAVATGPLVWNRHKEQLRTSLAKDLIPIVWAECVAPTGAFRFPPPRSKRPLYIRVRKEQRFLVANEPCVLVQRTTAKEQPRRLVAAVVPNEFTTCVPGFVVENHLNVVYATTAQPAIGLATIAALLNAPTVDEIFRCLNGSVAVSAYELNALPLPGQQDLLVVQRLISTNAPTTEVEAAIQRCYEKE